MKNGGKSTRIIVWFTFLVLFYYIVKIKNKEILKYKADLKRMQKLHSILNRWIILEICKKNIVKVLEEKGYQTAAVYGMGELGQRLVEKLEIGSCLDVIYGIDRNANISSVVPVYQLDEALKAGKPDVIILTVVSQDDSLVNELRAGFACPVIRVEELLNEAE